MSIKMKPVMETMKEFNEDDYRIMLDPTKNYYKNITSEMFLFPYNPETKTHHPAKAMIKFFASNDAGLMHVCQFAYNIYINKSIKAKETYICQSVYNSHINKGIEAKETDDTVFTTLFVTDDNAGDELRIMPRIRNVNTNISFNIGSKVETVYDDTSFAIKPDRVYAAIIIKPIDRIEMVRFYDVTKSLEEVKNRLGDSPRVKDTYPILASTLSSTLIFDYEAKADIDSEFLLFNSLYSTYTSTVYDLLGKVSQTYTKVPMMTSQFFFNNFMEYARFEDITPYIVVDSYHYFNDIGLAGDIQRTDCYTIRYMHYDILDLEYTGTGFDKLWWTKYNLKYFKKNYSEASNIANEKAAKLAVRVFRDTTVESTVKTFKMEADKYGIVCKSGTIIACNDFQYALVIAKVNNISIYDEEYSITLNDYIKNVTVFNIGIGMRDIKLTDGEGLEIAIVSNLRVSEKLNKLLTFSNTYRLFNNKAHNKSYMNRHFNGLEGTLDMQSVADEEGNCNEWTVYNMDSVFYKIDESNKVLFVRDMFGIPTPILLS